MNQRLILLHHRGQGALVEQRGDASAEDYTYLRKEFIRAAHLKVVDSVEDVCVTYLYSGNIEQGVPYTDELANINGIHLELFRLPGMGKEQVQAAKNIVKNKRDVVRSSITRVRSWVNMVGIHVKTPFHMVYDAATNLPIRLHGFDARKDTVIDTLEDFGLKPDIPGPIKRQHHLVNDLGVDSLDTVEIIMAMEEEFDVEVNDLVVQDVLTWTVQGILDYLNHLLGPAEPWDENYLYLTTEQFIERYKPIRDPDRKDPDHAWKEWDWNSVTEPTIKQAISERRCWTMVVTDLEEPDEDGLDTAWSIEWGNRVVNRAYNIITKKPLENYFWQPIIDY